MYSLYGVWFRWSCTSLPRFTQKSNFLRFSQQKKRSIPCFRFQSFPLFFQYSTSKFVKTHTGDLIKHLLGPNLTDRDPYLEILKQGLEAQDKGDLETALRIYNELIDKYPDDPRGWLQRGYVYFLTNKIQEAINDFKQVLKFVPRHVPAYVSLGACYERLQDYEKALIHYDHVLYLDPKFSQKCSGYVQNVSVLLMRGSLHWKQNQIREAIQDFEQAVKLDPKNENALKELASSYLQTGKFPEALQTFDLLLEVNPKNSFAFTGKGIIYYSLEKFAEAVIQFNAVLRENPNNPDVLVKRASCFLNLGNIEKAFTDCQQALQLDANFYLARLIQGQCYMFQKKYQEAIEDFTVFIKEDQKSMEGMNLSAETSTVQLYQHSEVLLRRAKCYINLFLQQHNLSMNQTSEQTPSTTQKPTVNRLFLEKLKLTVKKIGDPLLSNAFTDCIHGSKVFIQNNRIPSELFLLYDAIELYLQHYKYKNL